MVCIQRVQLAVVVLVMCWTCVNLSTINGQQLTTENDVCISKEELDNRLAEVVRETAQQMNNRLAEAAQQMDMRLAEVVREDAQQDDLLKATLLKGLEDQNDVIVRLEDHIDHLLAAAAAEPRHEDDVDQIAFSVVSHSSFGPVEEDTVVPFPIIYTNIGGNWNTQLMAFMAAIPGVYHFTANVRCNTNSPVETYVNIVHSTGEGDTTVATLISSNSEIGRNGNSNSVIIELSQGDFVWVQLEGNGGIISSSSSRPSSTFSGFLLFQ